MAAIGSTTVRKGACYDLINARPRVQRCTGPPASHFDTPLTKSRAVTFPGRAPSTTTLAASSGGKGPVGPRWSSEFSASVSDANLELSLLGKWLRQSGESKGAIEFLIAHGMTEEEAEMRSTARYEQVWELTETEGEWKVTTSNGKGIRTIVYHLGEWEEQFAGQSDLFGKDPGTVIRSTSWEQTSTLGFVHLTESATPLGWEVTQRHVEAGTGRMVVKRIFTPRTKDGFAGDQVSCVEYFERVKLWAALDDGAPPS